MNLPITFTFGIKHIPREKLDEDDIKAKDNPKNVPKTANKKKEETIQSKVNTTNVQMKNNLNEKINKGRNPKKQNIDVENISARKASKNVIWFGTSISKALNKTKLEMDTNTNVNFVKAFGIKAEVDQFYPESNFTDTVDKVLETYNPDAIVLQTGSIKISNIRTKKAYMDPDKDIEDYNREWAVKVENDSTNLFDIAEDAIKKKPNMKVIIAKRLPRFDPISVDPKGIKQKLFNFSNDVYDQLWFKRGGPKNIFVVDIDLHCSSKGYLKDLIFGKSEDIN